MDNISKEKAIALAIAKNRADGTACNSRVFYRCSRDTLVEYAKGEKSLEDCEAEYNLLSFKGEPAPAMKQAAPAPKQETKPVPETKQQAAPVPVPAPKPAPKEPPKSDLVDALANALNGKIEAAMNEAKVRAIAKEEAAKVKGGSQSFEVKINDLPPVKLNHRPHKQFEKVCKLVQLGFDVLLVGPAGTGKTTLAEDVAKAMNLHFSHNSMTAGAAEYALTGHMGIEKGDTEFYLAPFAQAYKDGGVHLLDELDAADPNMLLTVNTAIANGKFAIPVAGLELERNKNFHLIATANTFGNGASRVYCGRNQLDAATLDRFCNSTVFVDYDTELEGEIAEGYLHEKAGAVLEKLYEIRQKIADSGLRRIMGTRAIIGIARKMAAGIEYAECMKDYFTSWNDTDKRVICA